MADQDRSQPTAPKGFSNNDIQNARCILFKNGHSEQGRAVCERPDALCLALTLHPF